MTIESNRKLGGIGSLLTVVAAVSIVVTVFEAITISSNNVPNFGVLGISGALSMIGLVGFVLFLIAMYGFSKDYQEPKIFGNIIRGLIATVVAGIVAVVIWVIILAMNITSMIPALSSSTTPFTSSQIQQMITPATSIFTTLISLVTLVWIFYFYKAFNLLAEKSEVTLFSSAAKVFVLGAVITVVLSIAFAVIAANGTVDYTTTALVAVPGSAVQYVAWAIAAKGFFSIKIRPKRLPKRMPLLGPLIRRCGTACTVEHQIKLTQFIAPDADKKGSKRKVLNPTALFPSGDI